jgi:hypothetical protein
MGYYIIYMPHVKEELMIATSSQLTTTGKPALRRKFRPGEKKGKELKNHSYLEFALCFNHA